MKARIIRIGNSRGVRIPKALLEQTRLTDDVQIEAQAGEIVIRSARAPRADWEAQFSRMASAPTTTCSTEQPLSKTSVGHGLPASQKGSDLSVFRASYTIHVDVRDVFQAAKLTCPRTIRELACHMSWHPVRGHEDGDLLESRLVTARIGQLVAENSESFDKARNRLFAPHCRRPERKWRFRGPPPPSHVIGCPRDTVVTRVFRARDLKFTFA
jgi:antitoxin MazE